MRVFLLKTCGLLLLLLMAGIAHADGNCPPGYYQVGGLGTSGCNPIPGYNQQPAQQQRAPQSPPEQWANRYGAITTDARQGVLGVSANMISKENAENSAMSDCKAKGGINCIMQIWYINQCVAMVVGGKIFNVNPGSTINEATQKGMQMCKSAANDCHVYYTACSLPVRVQ